MSDLPMQGRVALVAGASKGIGAVTAQAFADAGAAVVIAARDAAAVQDGRGPHRGRRRPGDRRPLGRHRC